jgi:hypothetical protein
MRIGLCLVSIFWLSVAVAAEPTPLRLAVLVGNDTGRPVRPALRYAVSDARKMRDVLVRVGGFARGDVMVLENESRNALFAALDNNEERIRNAGERPVLLLFYFSGHADGAALELGDDAVPFAAVRKRLDKSGAKLRIALIDACLSGRMVQLRGATLAPEFTIDVSGELAGEGTVILASTAADEMAQESEELGGAVFTHHLVSGLYGAADEDNDLKISLRELYRYTYGHTLGATAQSLAGPQHPAYGYELEGKGDVVMGAIPGGAAILGFPSALPGSFFVLAGGGVVTQVDPDGKRDHNLALPSGTYSLLRRQDGRLERAQVALGKTGKRTLGQVDFEPTTVTLAKQRGGGTRAPTGLIGFYALTGWFMPRMGPLHSGGLMLRREVSVLDFRFRAGFGAATVNDHGFRYDMRVLEMAAAILLRIPIYRVNLLFGALFGLARLTQESAVSGSWYAWSAVPGAQLAADIRIWRDLSLCLSWELDVMMMRRDGAPRVQLAPKATLGIGYAF